MNNVDNWYFELYQLKRTKKCFLIKSKIGKNIQLPDDVADDSITKKILIIQNEI